jgi:hypothetical protein
LSIFMESVFGVRLFIWLFFLVSLFLAGTVVVYWKREAIKEKYYKVRFPEKVIKIVIHYKGSSLIKQFWRLIPDRQQFSIEGKKYQFNDKTVIKESDSFVKDTEKRIYAVIEGKEYNLEDKYLKKVKGNKYPQIEFFYNNPFPINFDAEGETLELSATEYQKITENDLFQKLLTLQGEKSMLLIIMLIGMINLVGTVFIIAKMMNWIK